MTDSEEVEQADRTKAHGRGTVFVPNPRKTLTYRVLRWLLKLLMTALFSPRVEGPGKVPEHGPAIIAPVHRSLIDFGFAIFLTDRKMFFIAKDSLWKNRLLGRFCLAMGAFPVHREAADRAALLHAQSVLEAGEVLVLFPEGTRHDGPEIGDILEGATFLSARVAAPIIPVGLGGTAQAMPVGNKLPRRSKVSLYAGEVIEPPERNEGGRVLRSAIREKTIQLRQALQDCFDRASA